MSEAAVDSEIVQLDQHVPFTMVENNIIASINDYVALGLYLDMRSRPRGWRFNLATMARTKKQGRDALSSAMKQLIELGLVFRVKFQRPNGHWATRIYVAQRQVTAAELLEVRASYSGRCSIVTSADLTAAANPARAATNSRTSAAASIDPATATTTDGTTAQNDEPHKAKALVTPTDGKPAVGDPTIGQPTSRGPSSRAPVTGSPNGGEPDANYQDSRDHLPPPTPSALEPDPSPGAGEEEGISGRPTRRSATSAESATPAHDRHTLRKAVPAVTPSRGAVGRAGAEGSRASDGERAIDTLDADQAAQASSSTSQQPEHDHRQDGGTDSGPAHDVLAAVTRVWTRLGRQDRRRLSIAVQDVLDLGVPPAVLAEHLTANPDGVRSPVHVLLARCSNHPPPPAEGDAPATAWCGDCLAPHHRWVEIGPNKTPTPCPRCNPAANPHHRAQAASTPASDEGTETNIRDLIATTRRNLHRAYPTR